MKRRKRKQKEDPAIVQMKTKDIKPVRAELLMQQGGVCLVCGEEPKRPCLDHSHTKRVKGTGLVRGVLCNSCNVFIAKSENNCTRYGFSQKALPNILRSMADYFERDHHPLRHPSEAPPVPKVMKSSYNKMKKQLGRMGMKAPTMSKSGTLTLALQKAFKQAGIEPEYYGGK